MHSLTLLRFHAYVKNLYCINKKLRAHTQHCNKNSVYEKPNILECIWQLSGWEFLCGSRRHNVYSITTLAVFPSSAYQNNDITEFEKILKTNHSNIMDDPFSREHIEGEWWTWLRSTCMINVLEKHCLFIKCTWWCDVVFAELLRNIRTQVLIKLIKPYTRIHIPFISKVSPCDRKMSCTVTSSVVFPLWSRSLCADGRVILFGLFLNGLFPF